ncbi:MAG TPA: lanthionine synthetase LanC family protein [Chloroflexia bacterium]|jgi:type 2 lantibiotic biosynthesis protein LanM
MSAPKRQDYLQTAAGIAAQLCRDALWDGARCNWLGSSMEPVGNAWAVVQRSFGPELYGGTSGIALFLARAHQMTGERIFRKTAEGAIRHAESRIALDTPPNTRVAFYSGYTGLAYVLIEAGAAFEDEELTGRGMRLLNALAGGDNTEQEVDIISGYAGAIPALLAIYTRHRQEFLLELAEELGEQLLKRAAKSDIGWSWQTLGTSTLHDLTGFAHGTAGIGHALLELNRATGKAQFLEAAEQAFRYERHWFSPAHENWPDFRNLDDGQQVDMSANLNYGVAWCHGAPGIGLSRVRAYSLLREGAYRAEAEAALRTVMRSVSPSTGGWGNYSLCHGLAGNAELLICAARALGDSSYKAMADAVGDSGIAQYGQQNMPWPCGVMGGGENPSLMLGLAGIGYFYLRLYDPDKVPSVLILQPDTGKKSTDSASHDGRTGTNAQRRRDAKAQSTRKKKKGPVR